MLTIIAGNVGIGTTGPGQKLDVSGHIAVSGTVDGRDVSTDGVKLDGMTAGSADTTNDSWTGTGDVYTTTGNVGIGTTNPGGKLDVNGTIYQRGSLLYADYVFEPEYKLESIEEHSEYMWREKHLRAIPKTQKDETGQEMLEIGAHRKGIVEELEKAHVYIQQLNERIRVLEAKITSTDN